jgi:hypothetical protein
MFARPRWLTLCAALWMRLGGQVTAEFKRTGQLLALQSVLPDAPVCNTVLRVMHIAGLLTALRPSSHKLAGAAYPLAGISIGAVTGLAIYNGRHAISRRINDIQVQPTRVFCTLTNSIFQGEIQDVAAAAASRGQPPPPLPGPVDIASGRYFCPLLYPLHHSISFGVNHTLPHTNCFHPHSLRIRWGESLAAFGVPRREQPKSWDWPEWAPVRRVSDAEVGQSFASKCLYSLM